MRYDSKFVKTRASERGVVQSSPGKSKFIHVRQLKVPPNNTQEQKEEEAKFVLVEF